MLKWNLPVDPKELLFALQLGQKAAENHRIPSENMEAKGIDLVDEEAGDTQKI